jgi:hypothetical protein
MVRPQPFLADIHVPKDVFGQLVSDRVACRRHTRVLDEKPEHACARDSKLKYRLNLLKQLTTAYEDTQTFYDHKATTQLTRKFIALARMLEQSKAVAFLFDSQDEGTTRENMRVDSPQGVDGAEVIHHDGIDTRATSSLSLPSPVSPPFPNVPEPKPLEADLLHPLLVALVAYQLGGPVNAAYATRTHEWKLPDDAEAGMANLYTEGDTGNVFDSLCITKVWEERDGKVMGLSGRHDVFLTGDATPQLLTALDSTATQHDSLPVHIIYNSQHAALYYDCDNPNAIRKSVTMNFHHSILTDEDIRLLSTQPNDNIEEKEPRLTELVTDFPIINYSNHFHNTLFSAASVDEIFKTLSTFDIELPPVPTDNTRSLIQERFALYKQENIARLPPAVLKMESDIRLVGTYNTPMSFLDTVVDKARRDVHLPIGMNLFPQCPMDRNKEWARKFIRDLPEHLISTRIAEYAPALVNTAYTCNDLLSTAQLHSFARLLEHRCLELICIGFVDDSSQLCSTAALASALGEAIDGIKEGQLISEPWVDDSDLQIYRTRCLYLFWCADWLVCYLPNPREGPYMMMETEKAKMGALKIRGEVARVAAFLLRNWVAWSLFVDGLPQGGFFVRRPPV